MFEKTNGQEQNESSVRDDHSFNNDEKTENAMITSSERQSSSVFSEATSSANEDNIEFKFSEDVDDMDVSTFDESSFRRYKETKFSFINKNHFRNREGLNTKSPSIYESQIRRSSFIQPRSMSSTQQSKFSPLYVLALVAEMESERLCLMRSGDIEVQERQIVKKRPGRPRNVTLNPPELNYRRMADTNTYDTNDSCLYKKIKINRPYNTKDGEPQKIIIQQRKESEKSVDANNIESSSIDKNIDSYIIRKYGDIPESTFTTGWRDNVFVYICPEEDCKKYFPSISRAKRHYIIHTEAKPYKCPNFGCNKRFSRKDNMNQHCKSHCRYANN